MSKGPAMSRSRHLATSAILAAVPFLGTLSGCGGTDVPDRAEFIEKTLDSVDSGIGDQLEGSGVSSAQVRKLLGDYAGCAYDQLAKKDGELEKLFALEDQNEVAAKLGAQAPECAAELQKSITEQIAGAAGG
ncbi:MAG: hypothetical protein V9E99_02400 [Microthrixaceae bacterium]